MWWYWKKKKLVVIKFKSWQTKSNLLLTFMLNGKLQEAKQFSYLKLEIEHYLVLYKSKLVVLQMIFSLLRRRAEILLTIRRFGFRQTPGFLITASSGPFHAWTVRRRRPCCSGWPAENISKRRLALVRLQKKNFYFIFKEVFFNLATLISGICKPKNE